MSDPFSLRIRKSSPLWNEKRLEELKKIAFRMALAIAHNCTHNQIESLEEYKLWMEQHFNE